MSQVSAHAQQELKKLQANYKLTPATLLNKINPLWIPEKHLLYISAKVANAISKGNGRLTVSVPPRHGKSELITKGTSIWTLEHFPHLNVLLTSYGAELSGDFGQQVRDLIAYNNEQGLLNTSIRQDRSRVNNWLTPEGGGMRSVGLGGAITGRGAHVLLIDDYIKEIKEAQSQAHRDYIWDWFVTTALTRVEPGGTVIIIATRWHHDDLIGRIERNNPGGNWEHLLIPAESFGNEKYDDKQRELYDRAVELQKSPEFLSRLERIIKYNHAEDIDFLGRQYGEALFPERYSKEALNERKETLGTFFYNAMFQQIPEDDEAALTNPDWLEVVNSDELPKLDYENNPSRPIRVWDLAATDGAGDYTAGAHMIRHVKTDTTYVMHMVRKQLSPKKVENLVRNTAELDGVNTKIYIEQEPGSSGKALVEHYKTTVLKGFDVEAVPSNDGKIARAQPYLAACEHGKVKLMRGPWNSAYISEFASFPSSSKTVHDDQMDVTAIGYIKLTSKTLKGGAFGRRLASYTSEASKMNTSTKRVVFGRSKTTRRM